jgi:hypothetical protein
MSRHSKRKAVIDGLGPDPQMFKVKEKIINL